MRNVKESHINLKERWTFFPAPKERDKGKFIHRTSEDCDMIVALWNPKGLPDMYFFRYMKPKQGLKVGTQYGPDYFKGKWDKAFKNLGIKGVDLYGGTKHATPTALDQIKIPEQIQRGASGHTSKAFRRYMLPDVNDAVMDRQAVSQIQNGGAKHPRNNITPITKLTNSIYSIF